MAVYKHGVYVTEQPTGVVAPVQSTAGLQVVIGTAPINRASDPYHCTNTPDAGKHPERCDRSGRL